MVTNRTKKAILISSIILALFLILTLLFIIFYYLSYLTSTPGSILIFILLFWLFLRQAVQILVFPGSCKFWLRSIESSFCIEMSTQLLFKVRDLRHYAESLKSQEFMNLDSDIIGMIESIFDISSRIAAKKPWSRTQKLFYSLLSDLKTDLLATNVVVDSSASMNLWDWLIAKRKRTSTSIVFEDYPEFTSVQKVIQDCEALEERLRMAAGPVGWVDKLRRWAQDDFMGSADYMREDLHSRFKCEHFFVGGKTDCLLVTVNDAGPTMIYCNPNAGFYEFSFHRSEWFEFYCELGINLVLWNYPGYGRSPGPASLKKIFKDGEEIFAFLRNKKEAKVIGIHGESLGGAPACFLARRCAADFLFADRTFASLSDTALNNFGKIAFLGFRGACRDDVQSAENYLEAKCYKIISADFKDYMISDFASLKLGVAVRTLYSGCNKFPKTHIVTEENLECLLKALTRVSGLVDQLNVITSNSSKAGKLYQPLQEDLDLFENERFKELIQKLKTLLTLLEAGGCSILESVKTRTPKKSLISWILVFDIWGASIFLTRSASTQNTVNVLKNILSEFDHLGEVDHVYTELESIKSSINSFKIHFESRIEAIDSKSLSTSHEFKTEIDYESAGNLVSLTCGHAGPYSTYERLSYEKHLVKSKFINV